jgi:hypothetical protein
MKTPLKTHAFLALLILCFFLSPLAFFQSQWITRDMADIFQSRDHNVATQLRGSVRAASIIVAITSKASSINRRTWMRQQLSHSLKLLARSDPHAASRAVVVFVIGTKFMPAHVLGDLIAEMADHKDMLMLPDTPDADNPDPPLPGNDSATCLKVLRSAAWALDKYTFPFFVRLGDDSYFRIDYFLSQVADSLPRSNLLLGYCPTYMKYSFPDPHSSAVRYCSGMGFVMTRDAIAFLARNAEFLRKPWPEDAAVALWLSATHVKTVHDERFHDWEWRKCSNESIIIHKHKYTGVDSEGVMIDCFPVV